MIIYNFLKKNYAYENYMSVEEYESLLEIPDEELLDICKAQKSIFCEKESFWADRISKYFGQDSILRKYKTVSMKDYYWDLVKENTKINIISVKGALNIKNKFSSSGRKEVKNGYIKIGDNEYSELKEIGKGYNASVYCCIEKNRVLKVGNISSLELEYEVYKDLKKINFPVVDTEKLDIGVLARPYLDPIFFADKIDNFTDLQKKKLGELWKKSIFYTIVTFIPLDLKAENLWWDEKGEEWLLVDTGPKLDDDDQYKFEYTLDIANEDEFIKKVKRGDGQPLGFWYMVFTNDPFKDSRTTLEDRKSFPNKSIILTNDFEESLDYNVFLEKLHVNYMKIVQSNTGEKTKLFALRFLPVNQELIDMVRSDIKLSQASCAVLSECMDETKIVKKSIEAILKLKNETEIYHNKLSPEDKYILQKYTDSAYKSMNECLRDTSDKLDCRDENYKRYIVDLEKIISNGPKLSEDITVYRGIDDAKDSISREVSKALNLLEPGDFWEDRGFVSTSSQHPPRQFVGKKCCVLEIFLPKGTPAYYIGEQSSISEEEEIILLPGILLRYIGKRTDEKGILYNGRRVNVYMFECAECNVNRFAISPKPIEMGGGPSKFPFQPQDRKVGKDRLDLYHLKNMYNKYIPRKNKDVLRLMTWNVHEWRNSRKEVTENKLKEQIRNLRPDVLAIQEATGKSEGIGCKADMGSYGETLRNDLVIRKQINKFLEISVPLGYDRCMIVAGIEIAGEKILIGNLHLEVKSSKKRLENIDTAVNAIEKLAVENETKNIIILGDFNSYRLQDYKDESYRDLEDIKSNYGEKMNIFESIKYIESKGYRETFDIRKVLHPANTNLYGGRIDFIFVSPNFSLQLKDTYAYYSDLSDHTAIVADFILPENFTLEVDVEHTDVSYNIQPIPLNKKKYLSSSPIRKPSRTINKSNNRVPPLVPYDFKNLESYISRKNLENVKNLMASVKFSDEDKDKALLSAVKKGDIDIIKFLLDQGADINLEEGYPLYSAVIEKKLDVVKYLLDEGANPKLLNSSRSFYRAVVNNDIDMVKFLGERKLYPKGINMNDVVYIGNLDVLKYLLETLKIAPIESNLLDYSKDRNIINYLKNYYNAKKVQTEIDMALVEAVRKGDLEKVKDLLKNGADIHYMYDEPVRMAALDNKLEILKYLVEKGANIHEQREFALRVASVNGYFEIVKFLVEKGADISVDNYWAFKKAKENGHSDIVTYLQNEIDKSIKEYEKKYTPDRALYEISKKGDEYLSDFFIKKYPDININEGLRGAAEGNHKDLINFLVLKGADKWNLGLMGASESGNKDLVKFFINKGADDAETGMGYAAKGGHRDLVNFFIKKGAHNWQWGMTYAAFGGHKNLVNFFVNKGAQDWDLGLRAAAEKGSVELIDFFIQKGSKDWNSGMRGASAGGHLDLINFFIQKGAKKWDKGLLGAAKNGNPESARFFIDLGAKDFREAYIIARNEGNKEMMEYLQKNYKF